SLYIMRTTFRCLSWLPFAAVLAGIGWGPTYAQDPPSESAPFSPREDYKGLIEVLSKLPGYTAPKASLKGSLKVGTTPELWPSIGQNEAFITLEKNITCEISSKALKPFLAGNADLILLARELTRAEMQRLQEIQKQEVKRIVVATYVYAAV